MTTAPVSPFPFLPLVVGAVTLTGFDGFSYVGDDGRTYWSGATEPSEADAVDAVTNPRTPTLPVPSEVPAWRLHAVAEIAGLSAGIDAVLAQLPEPSRTVAVAAWHKGTVIQRYAPTTLALAAALGLPNAQVDDLFRQAAAIQV